MTAQPPPKTLGNYTLLSRLSVGGMAELFLAQDARADRMVVIKRIHPYLFEEERIARMFLDEARIAAQLQHPNVIQILELGKVEDSLFIAMEFIEGIDLWQLCEEQGNEGRTLPAAIAAYIGAQICAGLDHAHSRNNLEGLPLGIVHRDVNPKNVMVGFDGSVKLVDFGIAKARTMVENTRPGTIKGKYQYFAPEQVAEQPVDQRTDIFAIGITLYEIITGKNPFLRPNIGAMLSAICRESPPAWAAGPERPPELEAIVSRCLMKEPRQRYQRAGEVQADLEKFLHTVAGPTTNQRTLSQYLATLFRRSDDPTVPALPTSGRKRPISELLSIPPLRLEERGGPSSGLVKAARAFQHGFATGPSEESAPVRPELGTLPPTVSMGPRGEHARRADDETTLPIATALKEPGTEPAGRPRRTRGRVVAAGSFALVVVVAIALGAGLGAPPPALDASTASPTPATGPIEPAPVVPTPVVPAPVEPEPPAVAVAAPAPAINRVAVKFNGPPGVRITRDGRHHLRTGAVEQLKPGTYRLIYRCPGKTRGKGRYKGLTVTVPGTSDAMEVLLSCRS